MGCWLIVPPIVPQWSPGPGELIPRWWPCLHFFNFFGHPKNHQKIDPSKNRLFGHFWGYLAFFPPILDHFGIPRREKVKIVILWKSCSRLGGSTIFKVQTLPKSTWNREKRHSQQKSIKKRSLGRLFGEKIGFWWFLGSQGGPKNCPGTSTELQHVVRCFQKRPLDPHCSRKKWYQSVDPKQEFNFKILRLYFARSAEKILRFCLST